MNCTCQAPLSIEFSRQEYWSGLPFPSPGDLLNPGTEPASIPHSYTCKNGSYQKDNNNKCWQEREEKGTLVYCWWERKLVQPLWKTVWRFLKKIKNKTTLCVCVCVCVCISYSVVSDSVTSWTVACQAPLSIEFSRQEYWNGLPFPSPGDLPDPRIEPWSPVLQANSLPSEPPGKSRICPQCGRPGFNPWVGKTLWRRERLPTPVFWLGEFPGLYSPWGLKESDTTEWLSLSLSTYDPAILLLSIYTKQIKMLIRKDTCTPMFIAALFTIAKICKQSKCSLIKDVAYIVNGIYLKNEKGLKKWNLTSCDNTKELHCVVLSKISQTRKNKLYMHFTYVWNSKQQNKWSSITK